MNNLFNPNEAKANGFCIIQSFYSLAYMTGLEAMLETHGALNYNQVITIEDSNLINSVPDVKRLAQSDALMKIVRELTGANAVPVSAVILDKTIGSNWGLDWHQDLRISVRKKYDRPGYNNWIVEAGITNVVPPVEVLNGMITIRIQLDDCNERNGAVWAITGSHTKGIIPEDAIPGIVKDNPIHICSAVRGSVMVMHPLLLHKSPYSVSEASRRVLHIEYASVPLADGLEWR